MGLRAPVTLSVGAENGADRDAIRSALSILFSPGETRELRSIRPDHPARCRIVSGDDLEAATDAAMSIADGQVYWSLNPISPDAQHASKSTVLRRAWLLIDLDTVRPKDVSATELEKARSYAMGADIIGTLELAGWPEPVFIDSGNGHHILYRVDLPNDSLSHQILKAALESLGARFDTECVKVDAAVHDAPRISKLPGTMARKGEDTPERPHRLAAIICSPVVIKPVDVVHLQALSQKPAPKKGKPLAPVTGGGSSNLARYVETAINRECERVALAPLGNGNNSLNRAAFSLGTMAGWPEMGEQMARAGLSAAAVHAGQPQYQVLKTIESGWTSGKAEPRRRPEPETPAWQKLPEGTSLVVWANTIKPKSVEWLWPRRIPLGKLTTFAGQGGLGKTFVICDIAARVSKGLEWPFCGGECAEQGRVLFISAEDDEDDTLVPRLMECGADLSQIAFLSPKVHQDFTMAALELLTRVLDEMGDVRLVAIDPPTSFLDGVDSHKDAELRTVLGPYKQWCAERRVSVIMNNHVNKSIGKDVDAASRVMGSVAWVNAVRTAHLFMREEDEPDRVVFAPIKTNVGKLPSALTYRIRSTTGDLANVEWLGEEDKSADQILSGKGKSKGANAVEWLTGMFLMQREWPSNEIKRLAKEAGITNYALWESKEVLALPIDKPKRTGANGDTYHVWVARPGWPQPESSESCDVNPGGTPAF